VNEFRGQDFATGVSVLDFAYFCRLHQYARKKHLLFFIEGTAANPEIALLNTLSSS
jgi:hypothetical protein